MHASDPAAAPADLAELIHYVAAIPGIERIRYTTSHPVEFTDALLEAYEHVPELVSHLHLPVQSGSDRILSLMKRGHTAADYVRKIEQLRAIRPGISLSSDFIIGFPGETDEDFDATMSLIETGRLRRLLQFHLQRPTRNSRGRPGRRYAHGGEEEATRCIAGAACGNRLRPLPMTW